MINRIIINGRALTGKDTIADYLVERYGYTKISFAEGIYKVAFDIFNMGQKDRWLLQQIGKKMREIEPNVWIDYVMKKINSQDDSKWVISDLRRTNEYIIAINNGFIPIKVYADLDIRIERAINRDGTYPNTDLWENESETGADNFSYIEEFENNETKIDIYKKIDKFMNIKEI